MSGEQPVRTSSTGDIPGTTGAGTSAADPDYSVTRAVTRAVAELMAATHNPDLCAHGWHAWAPWLRLDNGSFVTWCVRDGCDHHEQYDPSRAGTVKDSDT